MIDDAYAMIGRWLGDDFFSNRLKSALFMEMVPYQVFNFYDFFFSFNTMSNQTISTLISTQKTKTADLHQSADSNYSTV